MIKCKLIPSLVVMLLLCLTTSLKGQGLIQYIQGTPELTPDQQHYFDESMRTPFAVEATFATIDFDLFERSTLTLNLPGGLNFYLTREERENVPAGRVSWIGRESHSPGAAHFTFERGSTNLVAQIQFDDASYVISPISGGLHAIVLYDMTIDEGCLTPAGRTAYSGEGEAVKGNTYGNQDLVERYQEENPLTEQRTTGECNIRVFVGYTDDVDANRVDIYSDIVTMVNLANTGYSNCSGVTYSIELAASLEYAYAETGNMNTDLNCITNTSDGCLDDFHTQRNLWDADQCVLLTANGSGLAWVSLTFGNQFSVTGQGNFFALTFHHELGHNALLTHAINQASQPGTAPYAGWGEPTTGCFRTVLAYPDACGTGPCPRQNIFSDNDANWWSCGGTNYTPGTSNNRNQDRLNLSRGTINGFNTVGTNITYGSDYNWFARESCHFAANSTLAYNSAGTNKFEFFSGSHGTFRATTSVTLGTGFHARIGSDFRAYTENCSPLPPAPPPGTSGGNEGPEEVLDESERDLQTVNADGIFGLNVYPNPFSSIATLAFELTKDAEVGIKVVDATGRTVAVVQTPLFTKAGTHELEFDGSTLSEGIYHCILQAGVESQTRKIIIHK